MEGTTEDPKYRCVGAFEIQFWIHELGYPEYDTPSMLTIKHIFKRNGLVVQKRKKYIRCKSKKRYTLLNPTKAKHLLNSSELCIIDYLPEIVRAGVSSIRIEARAVESERCRGDHAVVPGCA